MRTKWVSTACVIIIVVGLFLSCNKNLYASEDRPMIDGSYLTHDNESIGYDTKITRGEDLLTGYSKCVRLGPGKIYAGGTTFAAHVVDSVQIAVTVERAKKAILHGEFMTVGTKERRIQIE